MNTRNENKLSMAKAVQQTLTQSASVLSSTPAFITAQTELTDAINDIDALVQAQQERFSAADKAKAEDAAISTAMELIGPAKSYAIQLGDETLISKFDHTPTSLKRLRDTDFSNALKVIRDALQDKLPALTDYGVTAAQLTSFTDKINAFDAILSSPRTTTTIRAAATEQLNPAFEDLDKVLMKLDGLAEAKKNSHADFYINYQNARKIVDNKGGGEKEEVPPVG